MREEEVKQKKEGENWDQKSRVCTQGKKASDKVKDCIMPNLSAGVWEGGVTKSLT